MTMLQAVKSSSKCCDHNTDEEIMIFGVSIKTGEKQKRECCCCSVPDSHPSTKKQRTHDDLGYEEMILISAHHQNPPPPPPKHNSDQSLSRTLSLDLSLSLEPPNSNTASSTTTTTISTDLTMFTGGASTSSSSINGTGSTQEEEEQVAAPIPLAVVVPAAADHLMNAIQWTIKKPLTDSDCNKGQCRLLIPKKSVVHVLKYLNYDDLAKVTSDEGLPVRVCDCDTRGGYEVDNMKLQYWKSSRSYVLKGNWFRGFVIRRELAWKMQVGLAWDPLNYKLLFSVLERNLD